MVQRELDHPIDLPQQQDDLVDPHTHKILEDLKLKLKDTHYCKTYILRLLLHLVYNVGFTEFRQITQHK